MRTDMSVPLWQLFDSLGKPVTEDNYIQLCTIAASMPDVFYYAYRGPDIGRAGCMAYDIAEMYCKVRGLPFWSPYASLARETLKLYVSTPFVYTDKDILKQIFDTLDEATSKIRNVLSDLGLPELRP